MNKKQIRNIKIFKTLLSVEGEGIYKYDTIEYEGDLWLVPEWIDNSSEGYSRPTRIIRLTFLPHTRGFSEDEYVLQNPIPKFVFEGHVPLELKRFYVVIENPEIFVDIRS